MPYFIHEPSTGDPSVHRSHNFFDIVCNCEDFCAHLHLAFSLDEDSHSFVFHISKHGFHDCLPPFINCFAFSRSESLCVFLLGRSDSFRRKIYPAALLFKERATLSLRTADAKPGGYRHDPARISRFRFRNNLSFGTAPLVPLRIVMKGFKGARCAFIFTLTHGYDRGDAELFQCRDIFRFVESCIGGVIALFRTV